MKQVKDNSAYYPEQHNTFDFNKFASKILRNWYWFALSIFIGLVAAWMLNHFMQPEFNIHSSLIINEYESGIKKVSMSNNYNADRNVDVLAQDHAGRLKSHIVSLNTLQSLGWNISWFQKTPLYGRDLYGQEPYKVILLSGKINLTDVPISITSISDSEFRVDVESKTDSLNQLVKFSQKGKFGEPFENKYFGFTLEKAGDQQATSKNIYFVINNLNNLALQYQKKFKVISNEKKPDLLQLILTESNSKRGVEYLNRLEQTYIEYGLDEKNRVAQNTIEFIDNQLRNITDSLSNSEKKFTNFRTQTQSVDLNQAGGMAMQKQQTLESEKAILDSRLAYLRSLRDEISDSKQMKQIVLPSVFGITDQTLNTLVSKLSDLYSRREVLSFSVQEKAPSLMLLDKEIQLNYNMLSQNISSLLHSSESDLKDLNRRAGGFSSQLSILPKTEQQLSSLKRNFELNNELFTYLMKMRAESAITYASNQPDVKVLDPARIETSKQTSPMTIINYLIALILGLFIPLSVIILKDILNGSIQSKEELEELTKLPLAGTIMHNKSKKDLVIHENPQSSITESFRQLRTNLKYILNGQDKNIIAVQSAIAGEGKSFVAMNLSSILAVNNFKVLLVGVDMRMSTLDKSFKSSNKKGLSTYLSNQDSFEDITQTSSINNLSYVTSGPIPPNPAELLENGNFTRFLTEAKSRFDYIILDNPPVSLVTDGIIAGCLADVNLFVIRFRYSDKNQIKFINELEMTKSLPNVALVLNDAIKENFGNGNYYNKRNKGYFKD